MKKKTKAVCDTPKAERDFAFYWRLGWSNHPRDIEAAKLFLARNPKQGIRKP